MKTINMDWMNSLLKDTEIYQAKLHENVLYVTDDIKAQGYMLYRNLRKRMDDFVIHAAKCGVEYDRLTALEHCITKDVCKYLSYDALYRLLFDDVYTPPVYPGVYQFVKNLYKRHLGITDEKTLELAEQCKLSGSCCFSAFSGNYWYAVNPVWPQYITIEDKASFKKRKRQEAIKEQKRKAKEAKQKKFEAENPPMTHAQIEAFKKALIKKYGSLRTHVPESQKQSQNAPN